MPAPKNPTDEDFNRFDFRPQVRDFPAWKGTSSEGDPASGPANQLNDCKNIRSDSEGYKARGGLSKGASNAATSDLDGIWEASDVGAAVVQGAFSPFGRYMYTSALLVADGFTPGVLKWDSVTLLFSGVQVGPTYDGVTPYYNFLGFTKGQDNQLYTQGALFDPVALTQTAAIWRINPDSGALTTIWSLPSSVVPSGDPRQGGIEPFSICESPKGVFYGSREGGFYNDGITPAPGDTYRNGVIDVTGTFSLATPTTVRAATTVFNGTLYTVWGSIDTSGGLELNPIRKRTGVGSWSNLVMPTPPVGYVHLVPMGKPVVIGTKLWFNAMYRDAGLILHLPAVLSVDTSDVVRVEHTIPPGGFGYGVGFPVAFNGFLYYYWTRNDGITRLAKYDGVTWTDIEWNCKIGGIDYFLFDFSPNVGDGTSLYAIAAKSGVGDFIIKSNGADTTTWTAVVQITGAFGSSFGSFVCID